MRHQIAAVGATLTASGLMLGAAGSVASAATPQTSQANAALRYLYSQVRTDGSVAGSMGATEDVVISVADSGHASTITTAGGAAKYVLAWVAAGKPSAIDGTALLTKLNTLTTAGGYVEAN